MSASSLLQRLKTDESGSLPRIPDDEPPGELNLFWPPSVHYTNSHAERVSEDEPQSSQEKGTIGNPEEGYESENGTIPNDSIYTNRLSSREVRLAVVAPPPKGQRNYPMHVCLEIYDGLRCPEYDAVSYTWGGENNDYTR